MHSAVLLIIRNPTASNYCTQSGVGPGSTSSYLWQVVWHLQSPPAGPPHWQPAAQRGVGSAGMLDKEKWGCVGGPGSLFKTPRFPFMLSFLSLGISSHVLSLTGKLTCCISHVHASPRPLILKEQPKRPQEIRLKRLWSQCGVFMSISPPFLSLFHTP